MTSHRSTVVVVRGLVQGVGFRWWARQVMATLGLEGHAENRADGTVRIEVRGPSDGVDGLLAALHQGGSPGRVDAVEVDVPTEAAPLATDGRPPGEAQPGAGDDRGAARSPVAEGGPPAHDPVRRRPDHEVVVVGGGPAGLSAALVLGRSRRSVLVVDDGAPRNRFAERMHGYLGHDGTAPAAFREQAEREVARYGVQVRRARVTGLVAAPTESLVEVSLDDGTELVARRVLVATGLVDELPDVRGVQERWGRDVLHCPYCHGWEFRDQRLVVLARAADEVDKALTVRQWTGSVTLLLDGLVPDDLPEQTVHRLAATGIEVVVGSAEEVVVEDDRLAGVRLGDGRVLRCAGLVVQPTVRARDELLVSLGAEQLCSPAGSVVVTDESGATGVPGVWATGNVAEPQAQVVIAAGQGYRAAVAIDHDLVMEDADAAVLAAGATGRRAPAAR